MYFWNTVMDQNGFRIGLFIILFKHGAVSFSTKQRKWYCFSKQSILLIDVHILTPMPDHRIG